jgi:hypothetical protein
MYISVSWTPINGTPPADVAADVEHALDPADFTLVYAPFAGLHMAAVKGNNLERVIDLSQTLLPLSEARFDFVIAYAPRGHYMYMSDPNVATVQCDALTTY